MMKATHAVRDLKAGGKAVEGDAPRRSALRKLTPSAQLPTGAGLRGFTAEQVQRMRRLLSDPMEVVVNSAFRSSAGPQLYAAAKPLVDKLLLLGSSIPHHENNHQTPRIKALTMAEERALFLAYNFARYMIVRTLKDHSDRKLTASAMKLVLEQDAIATRICDAIVQANLGLVPTMVERSRVMGVDFADLISEGHLALLRAISKFDCARGFKFSTYACRAILTSVIRSVALMARHRAHFPTEFDPDMQRVDVLDFRRAMEQDDEVRALKATLVDNRADLTQSEMKVLFERFGVTFGARPVKVGEQKTLREVAAVFGVTKERVRQIQNKALDKLRGVLDPNLLAAAMAASTSNSDDGGADNE